MLMQPTLRPTTMVAAWLGTALVDETGTRIPDQGDALYAELMRRAVGHGNDVAFASMLATHTAGGGVLPAWLGLGAEEHARLIDDHFPGARLFCWRDCRRIVDRGRSDERSELIALMTEHRAGVDESERWMATIVATACLGNDHLWQDLGLRSRSHLSHLMRYNFPTLAAKNDRDMKWKKFLYKQLCLKEGIYTCRAPSCAVCVDYDACFGPEE
jgi:nitrogen fixation protein NifQ